MRFNTASPRAMSTSLGTSSTSILGFFAMTDPAEPSDTEFFAALGTALHDWELVEMAMCSLMVTVVRSRDDRLVAEMFYSVQNFRDKLSMLDVALKFALWRHKILLPEWNTLNGRIKKRSQRRNRFAHPHTWSEHDRNGKWQSRLGPPSQTFSGYQYAQDNPRSAFTDAAQLRAASRSFHLLARCIREFDERVRELLMPRR